MNFVFKIVVTKLGNALQKKNGFVPVPDSSLLTFDKVATLEVITGFDSGHFHIYHHLKEPFCHLDVFIDTVIFCFMSFVLNVLIKEIPKEHFFWWLWNNLHDQSS